MIAKRNNKASLAFTQGNEAQTKNTVSTGRELFLFGNKIARWEKDGLYISNGGYENSRGNISMTTKTRLNDLPGVSVHSANRTAILNGKEWDGNWIKVEGVNAPEIKTDGNVFVITNAYKHTDGWRGYEEPIYAIVGANDTGMYSDSPCPSNIRESELNAIKTELSAKGIKTKQVVCQSSNVFCVHVYLVPQVKNVEKGREIVKQYLETNETRLAYLVKQ